MSNSRDIPTDFRYKVLKIIKDKIRPIQDKIEMLEAKLLDEDFETVEEFDLIENKMADLRLERQKLQSRYDQIFGDLQASKKRTELDKMDDIDRLIFEQKQFTK